MNAELNTYYDQESDVLYLAKAGEEEESVELQPGVTIELNKEGRIIGIEILHASRILKEIIEPLRKKAAV